MNHNKMIRCRMSIEYLKDMFKVGIRKPCEITKGIPEDAKLFHIEFVDNRAIDLYFYSETGRELEEGMSLHNLSIEYIEGRW